VYAFVYNVWEKDVEEYVKHADNVSVNGFLTTVPVLAMVVLALVLPYVLTLLTASWDGVRSAGLMVQCVHCCRFVALRRKQYATSATFVCREAISFTAHMSIGIDLYGRNLLATPHGRLFIDHCVLTHTSSIGIN